MKKLSMTSPNSEGRYKCNRCRDTTWIEGTNGMIRCECYEKEKINRLWNSFGVSLEKVKKLKDYKVYDDFTKKAKLNAANYIKHFTNKSFGLFGQNGSGKTHLAIAIGASLINKGIRVIYMPYVEALKELKLNSINQEYYIKLYNRYTKAQVLIIDDLFKDKTKNGQLIADITETDIKHFYPILNYRYNNDLPIVFSTECTPEMLLQLDEAQCGRILEKCEDNMIVFKGARYNYRMRNFIKESSNE